MSVSGGGGLGGWLDPNLQKMDIVDFTAVCFQFPTMSVMFPTSSRDSFLRTVAVAEITPY